MRLIHQDATAESVKQFTRLVFGMWVIRSLFFSLEHATCLPVAYFEPIGLLTLLPRAWIDWLWSEQVLLAMRMGLLGCSLMCVLGKAFRVCAVMTCLLATVEQSFVRGFGMMKHSEISLLLATLTLTGFALVGQGSRRKPSSIGETFSPHAAPLVTTALLLSLTYAMVGVNRLVEGGVGIYFSDTTLETLIDVSNEPWFFTFGLGENILEWPWLATLVKVGFPIVTLCEILAPWALVSRKVRILVLAGLSSLHILVFLFTKLLFFEHLLLLTLFLDFRKESPQPVQRQTVKKTNIVHPRRRGRRKIVSAEEKVLTGSN